MPAGLIEDDDSMGAGGNFGGNLGQVQVHRFGVAGRQHEGCSLSLLWADGAEDIGRGGALIMRG